MLYIHDKKFLKVFIHMKPEVEEGELNTNQSLAGDHRSQPSTEATALSD